MGGGGGYKAPKPRGLSDEEKELIKLQTERERREIEEADKAKAQAAQAAKNKKQAYKSGLGSYYDNLQSQIERGTLDYAGASQQLTDYLAKGGIERPKSNLFNKLQTSYNTLSDTRANTSVNRAYQTLLGRAPTAEELSLGVSNLTGGLENYSYDDLKDDIVNSKEYQDEYNRSYLENYYDSYYGEQTRDAEGNRTGERTFDFSDAYMPSFDEGLEGATGITTPTFGTFTGQISEIEEYQQSIRQARSFMYNAGLTNLQGDIDKELTKMKTQSAERVAGITGNFGMMSNLVAGFFNS